MNKTQIPLRPNNDGDFKMTRREKECCAYTVLTNCRNEVAFALFYPEYTTPPATPAESDFFKLTESGKRFCKQFFSKEEHRLYIASYRATITAFIGGGGVRVTPEKTEINESKKDRAVRKLISDVLDGIEHNSDLDPDTLKDFVDVAKKLNILKDEEEKIELPRRYLPETCSRCPYKSFIDENIKSGNIIEEKENE